MAPKKGAKRVVKERPAIDMGALKIGRVQDRKTMAEYRRTRGERDAEQKYWDGVVDQAYDAWVNAGKPTDWVDMPGTLVTVPASQLETLQWRVHRAGIHWVLKIRFGDIKKYTAENGVEYAEVVFSVTDRPQKDDSTDASEQEAADDEEAEQLDAMAGEMYGKAYDELTDAEADILLEQRERNRIEGQAAEV